jgi:hypothetical protein
MKIFGNSLSKRLKGTMTKQKIKEAKFQLAFIRNELDKAIELAEGNKTLIAKLKKIKDLLR